MPTYRITVKGLPRRVSEGNNPTEAFERFFPHVELVPTKNREEATTCIELLDGKRKSVSYYVGRTKQDKQPAKKNNQEGTKEIKALAKAMAYIESITLGYADYEDRGTIVYDALVQTSENLQTVCGVTHPVVAPIADAFGDIDYEAMGIDEAYVYNYYKDAFRYFMLYTKKRTPAKFVAEWLNYKFVEQGAEYDYCFCIDVKYELESCATIPKTHLYKALKELLGFATTHKRTIDASLIATLEYYLNLLTPDNIQNCQ